MAARLASDGLRRLNRATSDLSEARAAFERIAANDHRASKVVDSVRGLVAKTERAEAPLDIGELIRETVALVRDDLDKSCRAANWMLTAPIIEHNS